MHADELEKGAGALYKGNGQCIFRVWAPLKKNVSVHFEDGRKIEMHKEEYGYFAASAANISPGSKYKYYLDEEGAYPDPASFYQPDGVNGHSVVIDHNEYQWNDTGWKGLATGDLIVYELHVGTFSKEGTFEAIIPMLDDLVNTGINAIELMPVAQFPGNRNWGYDGIYSYAVQNSYGGPQGLKKFVDACHQKGIAVFLDVVYNHLGPEGNYFARFGPYFTGKYRMPWGEALNFDGPWSDGVKEFFTNNTLYWFDKFHLDGLRFDAIHEIYDNSAVNFWMIVHDKVRSFEKKCGRKLHLIAESDLNSPRVIKSPYDGGYGFDAQWLDDFHHVLYVLLDANGKPRYEDYGTITQLAKAYTDGFVLSGDWTKSRNKKFGTSSKHTPGDTFVAFNQNHDQIGNRVKGERLSVLICFERLKIAAAAVLLSPYIPMLFMGEEFGEDNPFYFFVDYSDQRLVTTVRGGRTKDFKALTDQGDFPDPQAEKTFIDSRINWEKRKTGKYNILLNWHMQLIALRNKYPALKDYDKKHIRVQTIGEKGFMLKRKNILCLFNLSEETIDLPIADPAGYELLLNSREDRWMENADRGNTVAQNKPGLPPLSVRVYRIL